MARVYLLCLLFFFSACGGISLLSQKDDGDVYSPEFLQRIGVIKELYRQGQSDQALEKLKSMNEEGLQDHEKAFRRNLIGVIHFSKNDYEQSIYQFQLALNHIQKDSNLRAQIYLNLASTYYKMGHMQKSFETLQSAPFQRLKDKEFKKFHRLSYNLARELGHKEKEFESLVWYLRDVQSVNELKSQPAFERLVDVFGKLEGRQRIRMIDQFEDYKMTVVGYLTYLEAERLYYTGEKSDAESLLQWIEDRFSRESDLVQLSSQFMFRIANFTKIAPRSIGVVLPLSGKNKVYGERALMGIDLALSQMNGPEFKYELHVKDSEGSGAVGEYKVTDLIEKNFVSIVIGGLFSQEAEKEYLAARKHGVLFVSLSQIYLPREKKDHLLIEIPGSVESQVKRLFGPEILNHWGKNAAIVYPNTKRGQAYVQEFWRVSQAQQVKVVGALEFDKSKNDYRDPVKNLLGLKFSRGRLEELNLLKDIHQLEKSSSIRRVQTLAPNIDFDWVFMPAFPREALQLVPSYTYFDAFNVNLIGGPSWRSRTLVRESQKLGKLHFVGDDVAGLSQQPTQKFLDKFERRPGLIEMRAYDSLMIAQQVINNQNYENRDAFNIRLKNVESFQGATGVWTLNDGLWLKNMAFLKLEKGKIETAFADNQPSQELEQVEPLQQ